MAISYAHSTAPTLAKVKLGSTIYYVKDADLRAIVEAFGTATAKDSTDVVTSTGTALPTESAVYDFITSQVGNLGKVVNLLSETNHLLVDDPTLGDMVIEATGKEWLYDGTNWREVGDESAYVPKTTEIAGIALSTDISISALQEALSLAALAYKDTATGTLTNYVNGITGADYTPEGNVTVTLSDTATDAVLTKADYTPEGSVTVDLTNTTTSATLTTADYTPEGNVSVIPTTTTFYQVASVGTAPSLTESKYSFATEGITAAIDNEDNEMLVFSTAGTSQAIYSTNWNAGEATTLASEATTVTTGISSATFTGTKATDLQVTGVSYSKAGINAAGTTFTGSKVANALVTGVSYDKANISSATFVGSSATITPTLTSTTKDVTVQ